LYIHAMDSVRSLIVARVAELGLSLSELSLKAGKNHAYFQQFIRRGVPERLPEEVRAVVAQVLRVDESQLKMVGKKSVAPLVPPNAEVSGEVQIATRIPVYGQAVGGKDGEFILNGNKVADILAPPSLSRVADAYAVYVVGDSMEPRYFAGEMVFVNPRLPISKGAFVVAQIAIGEDETPHAYVKRFVSRDARKLRLEQYNPKKILEFPTSSVVSVHRVIMGGER
jgi:phage repressor protein C with HTH and peptisase S24 domain